MCPSKHLLCTFPPPPSIVLCCTITHSKIILLFVLVVRHHLFHWEVSRKKCGPVLSSEFYLIQYFQNTIATCNHCKKINEIFCILFILSLQNLVCILHIQLSLFGLATYQVLNSCMWLVSTLLDSTDTEDSL